MFWGTGHKFRPFETGQLESQLDVPHPVIRVHGVMFLNQVHIGLPDGEAASELLLVIDILLLMLVDPSLERGQRVLLHSE
jgi:hypothetical protein